MTEEDHLLQLSQQLLDAIACSDWQAYTDLCAEDLTAFEPEAAGQRVDGLAFHRFYFEHGGPPVPANTTMINPAVRFVGADAAIVTCVRLVQRMASDGPITQANEETRVWERRDGRWWHVHFHRSTTG